MKFSFALIARNEANTLPRLVKSLEKYMAAGGEIVLLDTGSTDGTAEVARSLGVKVTEVGDKYRHVIDAEMANAINARFLAEGEYTLVNSETLILISALARNHAASLASNDMVSFVDADEVLKGLDYEASK